VSAQQRDEANRIVEELRARPYAHVYSEMVVVALEPESKLLEIYRTAMDTLGEWSAAIGIFMAWPLWRLWRFVQRRMARPIRAQPSRLRRAMAGLFDLAFLALVVVVAGTFVESAIDTAGYLLKVSVQQWRDIPVFSILVATGAAYLLLRDAMRLRFRRSLGKAMFDLRPVAAAAPAADTMTMRLSMKRNAVSAAAWSIACALLGVGMAFDWVVVTVVGLALVALALLVNACRALRKERATFADKWSNTRVIDADSPESLAMRP
jgi:hypothetical protein